MEMNARAEDLSNLKMRSIGEVSQIFVELNINFYSETYTKEELARKSEALDDVVKKLEEKYKNLDYNVKDEDLEAEDLDATMEEDYMDIDAEEC